MIHTRARTAGVLAVAAALAFTPPAAVAGGFGSRDCEDAIEALGKAEVKLAAAKQNGASRKRIKELKKKVRKAERKVERECDSPG